MTTSRFGRVAGAFEHPGRDLPGYSHARLYQEIAYGALRDAGLGLDDVDSLFTSTTPGGGPALAEVLGLRRLSHIDWSDLGGASYVAHAGRAAARIAAGESAVALVIMGGLPRQGITNQHALGPREPFRDAHGSTLVAEYALAAARYMHETGTTRRDLAEVKASASYHASLNPHAFLPRVVTVDEVLDSPPIAEPLHRLDCCVTTDGGGALVIVNEEIARSLARECPAIVSVAEYGMHWDNGRVDLTRTIASRTGPLAFDRAGVAPADVRYASVYDSFTITAMMNLEGLGFFDRGCGAAFVRDGGIRIGGHLPVNTDGGGLSSNHPDFRGGMIRMIEAVRQVRATATPAVQVPECDVAVVHGTGMSIGSMATGATLVLKRSDVA